MCTSCDETYRIIAVEITTKEPVTTNMDLFKEIARRLFEGKIITNINIDNNKAYISNDKQLFGFHLHLGNTRDPLLVTLASVETALAGVLEQFEEYSECKFSIIK